MSKYKVGDKFIVEITHLDQWNRFNGDEYYHLNGFMELEEGYLNRLQPYHEPTLVDMARKIQDNCEKYYDGEECNGCDFAKGSRCVLLDGRPDSWELEQKTKLTEEEIEILEFWKKQDGRFIKCEVGGLMRFYNKRKGRIGSQAAHSGKLCFILRDGREYDIDDLLKGE